jgi:hypothetical protein
MRNVFVSCIALLVVTGCATVSMAPVETVIEARVSQDQTQLREICDAYTAQAETGGWVTRSTGLFGLAKILVDGVDGETEAPKSYADMIEAETGDTSTIYQRLRADIATATTGLNAVVTEAEAFLETTAVDTESLRDDVMALENALVTAQKSRRNFAKTLTIVAKRNAIGVDDVDADLARFDDAIDATRDATDRLADKYASAAETSVVS